MAAAQPSDPAPAAFALPPFKHRRRCREGPDPSNETDEQKQGTEHASPVARLYRHALESVFAFLDLADLSRVLSASRSWSAAVRSMKSIGATLTSAPPPRSLAASPLASHVHKLAVHWMDAPLSSHELWILSRDLVSLTSLSCSVDMALSPRLSFASTLRSLTLSLEGDESRVPIINDAIVVISRLSNLTTLSLTLPELYPALSFAPLATAARLQDLTLDSPEMFVEVAPRQLDQLRALPHLRKMAVDGLNNDCLAYLLRAPHSLQWQEIHTVRGIDDAAAATLATLRALTKLVCYQSRSVAFLPSLARLRTLELRMDPSVRLAADIAAGLSRCSQLTDLTLLVEDVASQHLSQAISHLPLLCKLELRCCSALESLSFLSECAHLAQSLQSLELRGCSNAALHSTDLKHVLTLKNLTALTIWRSFVEPLDARTQRELTPPSVVLSKLQSFQYCPD